MTSLTRSVLTATAAILFTASLSSAAEAGWRGGHHGHHGRHHDSGGYLSFSFYSPPEPFYYEPQPVYYHQPQYIPAPYPANYNTPQDNRYCREYNTTTRVGGRYQPSYGTACLQPDGAWQIID